MAEVDIPLDISQLSDQLAGLVVSRLTQPTSDSIAFHFTGGAVLVVRPVEQGFAAVLHRSEGEVAGRRDRTAPTRRQAEYLEFIKRYLHRFGVAPAESDIQRHFMVSAPSVNQMVRTLERRGFISRDRDWLGHTVPRSIRVTWEG